MNEHAQVPADLPPLPRQPVDRLVAPLAHFLRIEAAGGGVLLLCTVAALCLANSPLAERCEHFWETSISIEIGTFRLSHPLLEWLNDGLMAIFFFVVGLEVKRELIVGELRELRVAMLPLIAAAGGMIAPALIYFTLQGGRPGERGWGIPVATDIAFVIGCLALLGPAVPRGLRVFLLSLAIFDDIGAILVIALGYAQGIHPSNLILALAGIAAIAILLAIGVRSSVVYLVLAVVVWLAVLASGVHATIAGVILGLLTPARSLVGQTLAGSIMEAAATFWRGNDAGDHRRRRALLRHLSVAAAEAISPLERLETTLHPWVSFGIVPLFALANAGVPLQLSGLTSSVSLAVILGLLLGKPIGIFLACVLAVKCGAARLPNSVNWTMVLAAGMLGGIGFTMAIFIANLALHDEMLADAKIGILAGSALSAVAGMLLLWRARRIT